MRNLLCRIFSVPAMRSGLAARAGSPQKGIASARTFRPEVVLCDIGLPRIDGYEVAKALRQDGTLKEVYLGAAMLRTNGAHDAGFNAYVMKPVDFDALERMLAGLNANSAT